MNVSLIIAAGGRGERFLKDSPLRRKQSKLFYPLGSKPLLAHTLDSFRGFPQIREILIALPRGTEKWVRDHVLNGPSGPRVCLVAGGATRAQSVWNALRKSSPKNKWVLVHDGARPFPPKKEIQALLRKEPASDGVILARPVIPTLKRVDQKGGRILATVDRTHLFEAQTPQLVRRSTLEKAYRENPRAFGATDESSLIESMGGRMKVRPHTGWNVKVTTPEDLNLAEAYCSGRTAQARLGKRGQATFYGKEDRKSSLSPFSVGFGRDTHRLVVGRKLYLGGIHIPFEKGALGHSDGDGLLHAISDALLGAIGAGDIGEWFSDKNPRFKNIRSREILKKVLEEARHRSWVPAQIDSVITLERPHLGSYKKAIRKHLARLLGLKEEAVSVKAKTQEGLGPEGEGRAVTCEALVLMRRFA